MRDTPTYHPCLDEHGRKHLIASPSRERNLERLADPRADVTFIPGSQCAGLLNGVVLAGCPDAEIGHALWRAGAEPLDEPAYLPPPGRQAASGAVVLEPDGRLWLVAPSNAYGGYQATFPKGRASEGLSLQATAIREVWEESGLRVRLTAFLGDFSRTQTWTRFYLAQRTGGHPGAMGWESQAVHLATIGEARRLLNRGTDHAVLDAVAAALAEHRGPRT